MQTISIISGIVNKSRIIIFDELIFIPDKYQIKILLSFLLDQFLMKKTFYYFLIMKISSLNQNLLKKIMIRILPLFFSKLKKYFLWDYSYKISFYGQFKDVAHIDYFLFSYLRHLRPINRFYLESYENNYFLFSIVGIRSLDQLAKN